MECPYRAYKPGILGSGRMWEAINNAFAPSAADGTAKRDPKDPVAKCGMPVPADRIDQQGDVWNGTGGRCGGKWAKGWVRPERPTRNADG